MNNTMNNVRYSFMNLRNMMRLFSRNKNKQIILDQIDLTIHYLKQLKKELNK